MPQNRLIKQYDLLLVLLLLLVANYFLRWGFDLHFKALPFYFDQKHISYQDQKWYIYMLPSMSKLWGGTWSSLGIGLLPLLKQAFGNTQSYLYLNLLFIVTVFFLSWNVFKSKTFTITATLCASFTTFNDHVYQNASLVIIYIPLILCMLNLFSFYKLFKSKEVSKFWWIFWGITLLFYMLSFEGWLDYYAFIVIISPFCFYLLHRDSDAVGIRKLSYVLGILTLAAIIYIALKFKYSYASHPGQEHDLWINYGVHYIPLMIEDFISNFFTLFYITIITYLPPVLSFSSSALLYSPEKLVSLQNDYDAHSTYLTVINAITLWRFYAGVYLTLFFGIFYQTARHFMKTNSKDLFFILLFMAMILIGSPSHLLVKFRPMHIIPWLAYQTFLGQIGIIFLISYATKMLIQSSLKKKIAITVIIAIWLNIIMCSFVKGKFYEFGSSYESLINPVLLKTLRVD